jgi:phosphatidate cytidylyltransferase
MKRILTAIVLIAAVLALIVYGQLWMITFSAAIIAILAAYEYRQLANAGASGRGRIPLLWMMPSIVVLFIALYYRPIEAPLAVISALGMLLFAWAGFRAPLERVLPVTAAGIFGLLYVAYPLTLLPLLLKREQGDGKALLIFLLVCVWAGDIAALYVGRAIGKRKLAPSLSPGKTWEGAAASVLGSMLAVYGIVCLGDLLTARGNTMLHITEPLWQTFLLAAILNIAAQVGDLLESALKRSVGVKDSGTMLPGHGGILDRIDALLLAAPVLWYALLIKDSFGSGRF